ncbi:MAG: TRAP transporter small permease [Bacteriovoracaceae bacterium]
MKLIRAFDSILEDISRLGLVFCLFVILGFAVLSIILRWFGHSVMWIEPMIRHLVFLSAFLGGSLATSKDVHIRIDLLTKLVEKSHSKMLHLLHRNLVSLFSFVVCVILSKTSWDFFLVEKEFGAPSFLNIHSSYLVAIIPVGMGLISLRFFNRLIIGFSGENNCHSSPIA